MTQFPLHTIETADAKARKTLEKVARKWGDVPNVIAGMAEAPALADAYLATHELMLTTSFSVTERHVIWFTLNTYHGCHYCMAAHTSGARADGVDEAVIETARSGGVYAESRLEILKQFTLAMAERRGWLSEEEIAAFIAAGFKPQQVLEIVLAIANKVLSNYTNHLIEPPLDARYEPYRWQKQNEPAEALNLEPADILKVAQAYTAAWCNRSAEEVASFFTEDAISIINAGEPSIGRAAIAEAMGAFFAELPDVVVTTDDLRCGGNQAIYLWTLEGTNTGPGGTGNRVRISGWQNWRLNDDMLIAYADGGYDAADYERQIQGGN